MGVRALQPSSRLDAKHYSIVYRCKKVVRSTRRSSRNAKCNLFFRLAVPSLRSAAEGEIRPARMDWATCSRFGK